MTNPHPNPEAATPCTELQLAESWCRLTKLMALYDRNNSRVRSALGTLREEINEVAGDRKSAVELVLAGDMLYANKREIQSIAGGNLDWLQSRLHACALIGVSFHANPPANAILDFSERLLENFGQRTAKRKFEELWPMTFSGLRLIEMWFAGGFAHTDGPKRARGREVGMADGDDAAAPTRSEEQLLADVLMSNNDVLERIQALEDAAAPDSGWREDVGASDLIARIVQMLPVDAFDDMGRVLDLTVGVLDQLGKRGEGLPASMADGVDDAELSGLLNSVGCQFFGREMESHNTLAELIGKPQAEQIPASDRGHAGDDAITDDFEEFLLEFKGLPNEPIPPVRAEDIDVPIEQLGVFLHYLTHLAVDAKATTLHARLNELMAGVDRDDFDVLLSYLEPDQSKNPPPKTIPRFADFLRQTDATRVFETCGFLSVGWVVETFPHTFPMFLSRLDLDRAGDIDLLVETCNRLGPVRILSAGAEIAGRDGLLSGKLVTGICATPFKPLTPLVRLILQKGGERMKKPVTEYLRGIGLSESEKQLFAILPPKYVPTELLLALTDPSGAPPSDPKIAVAVSSALIRRIADTAGDPKREKSRIAAIRLLARYPSAAANSFLQSLLSKKFLVMSSESRPVRQAASDALSALSKAK